MTLAERPRPRVGLPIPELPHKEYRKGEVVLGESDIQLRVTAMADEIDTDFSRKGIRTITLLQMLEGARPFSADLKTALEERGMKVKLASVKVSSYGDGQVSSGKPRITFEEPFNPKGEDVLVADDMIDTGNSFKSLTEHLYENYGGKDGFTSLTTAAFLDKHEAREVDFQTDYVGFRVPKLWLEGYGLDSAGQYRELPFVRVGQGSLSIKARDIYPIE